ncbi:hypothetical protein AVEN_27214-1 [Araneus ventricosus]|uniref:Uncharacterized protein n=1 Tax=Araneus ventricosus TaxID=182803 RepID=A0A4Y2DWL2_ARAVE|nr:hypothetical protein AVEN_27214-1 [Araneus ventricosus]
MRMVRETAEKQPTLYKGTQGPTGYGKDKQSNLQQFFILSTDGASKNSSGYLWNVSSRVTINCNQSQKSAFDVKVTVFGTIAEGSFYRDYSFFVELWQFCQSKRKSNTCSFEFPPKLRITKATLSFESAYHNKRSDSQKDFLSRDGGNGPYAPFGFESIEKQLWRNKQNDRPISDSEIKAVLSQLFKADQWLPPAGHVSEDVTSHA